MISTMTITTQELTSADVMTYSVIAAIALIIFLAIKEVLSTEADTNVCVKSFVEGSNVAIVPLIMVFIVLVSYKVLTGIY